MTVSRLRIAKACIGGLALLAVAGSLGAQARDANEAPRLVVGIVVDQMRYDMLYRYWDHFGDGGFRRLVNDGFSFEDARFDYMPTFTGPGHASIWTGTTPAVHGILGNSWYVRELGGTTYVTDDAEQRTVGSDTDAGEMSPTWMLTTTIGDELRLHNNDRSRVLAVSLKDRGSILPAGHTGEAYWFDYDTGDFITSTYYREELPEWLTAFDARTRVEDYLTQAWEPLLPLSEYTASLPDDNPYEQPFAGQDRPVFPYDLSVLREGPRGPGLIAYTPFGDELLVELALAALEGEALGQGGHPDVLAISFSSPDHIGHQFGPASIEVQDTFLRLDRQLERLLDALDETLGRDNVLVFLTTDHGAPHVPAYLQDRGIPAGEWSDGDVTRRLRQFLADLYGEEEDLLETYHNQQVFLDHEAVRAAGLGLRELQEEIAQFMLREEGVAGVLTAHALQFSEFRDGVRGKVQRGFHPARSGDVVVWYQPNWIPGWGPAVRTTHGSGFSYDTRAPLIWYGWNVPAGRSAHPVFISDIAPTLAVFLNTAYPSGTTGRPMNELMR